MSLRMQAARNLMTPAISKDLVEFTAGQVHAVAGIGNPQRFFSQLKNLGLTLIEHGFTDHHRFHAGDICFNDGLPVLMTEKDAVKCTDISQACHWYIPVDAELDERIESLVLRLIKNNSE